MPKRSKLETDLRSFYKELFTIKEENGLEIYPVFEVLPVKKLYSDYYSVVKFPVSINTLKKRVPHYTDPQSFLTDVVRMAWNARIYNDRDSEIYKYAKILNKYIVESIYPRLRKLYPHVRVPYLGPLPDPMDEMEQLKFYEEQRREDERNGVVAAPTTLGITNGDSKKVSEDNEPSRKLRLRTSRVPSYKRLDGNEVSSSLSPSPATRKIQQSGELTFLNDPLANRSSLPYTRRHASHHKPTSHSSSNGKRGRPPIIDLPYLQRIKNVLKNLKRETDSNGSNPLTFMFEHLPGEFSNGSFANGIPNPICLEDIRKKAKMRRYKDFLAFEADMNLMLANYRIFYASNGDMQATIEKMGKRFKVLAQSELSKPDSYYLPEGDVRFPLDSVTVNNVEYEIGDWVLLRNPNDNSKPIVGQIFKLWRMKDGARWLNACWYFRPEQTVHRVDRLFYKNEVVKTGQYRDHAAEDILGKCYVVHFTRFQRGDPDINIDGPLFVCEFRYNEAEKIFNKIRTWRACLPEEIRDREERTIPVNGRKFFKYPSPIKHLRPPDATINSKIPQPKYGSNEGPPIIGAVYVRPKLERDDLGEYSTSDDCPRYIIRPGDPPEEGKVDFETGTITTNMITANALPRTSYSFNKMVSAPTSGLPLRKTNSPALMNSDTATSTSASTPVIPTQIQVHRHGNMSSFGSVSAQMEGFPIAQTQLETKVALTPQRLAEIQTLKEIEQKKSIELQRKYLARSTYNSKRVLPGEEDQKPSIIVNVPSAYILPLSITKNINVLQKTDAGHKTRFFDGVDSFGNINFQQLQPVIPKKRNKGDIIWFRGPSACVPERLLNSGSDYLGTPLNKILKVDKSSIHIYKELLNDDDGGENDITSEVHDHTDEQHTLPGNFQIGVRPSAHFMAYRLQKQLKGVNE